MVVKLWKWLEDLLHFLIYGILKMKLSNSQWTKLIQFVKFGLIGILNNLICYGTYLLLISIGIHYGLANIVGFSVSVINSYYWNNKYVFAVNSKRVWWKTLLKTYVSYAGTGIIFSNILLVFWIEILHVSKFLAPILNLVFSIPVNYFVNKLWAYK